MVFCLCLYVCACRESEIVCRSNYPTIKALKGKAVFASLSFSLNSIISRLSPSLPPPPSSPVTEMFSGSVVHIHYCQGLRVHLEMCTLIHQKTYKIHYIYRKMSWLDGFITQLYERRLSLNPDLYRLSTVNLGEQKSPFCLEKHQMTKCLLKEK